MVAHAALFLGTPFFSFSGLRVLSSQRRGTHLCPLSALSRGPLRIDFWLLLKSGKEKRRRRFPDLRTFFMFLLGS
jgi:hypothetical protein